MLVDQHVEGFGQAGFQEVVALDDLFVHLHATGHVVGLDGEELLQQIGRAVGLQGPDFHFAQPLAAKLRLAAQGLLGDQRVRARGACVDFFVHQVVQLEHVHDARGHPVFEGHARAAVVKGGLAVVGQPRLVHPAPDFFFGGAVKHGGLGNDAVAQLAH